MSQPNPVISLSVEKAVQANGVQSLARWSRILEIIIPAYMLGKSWGIAERKNIELFRMQFPPFLIDATEFLKDLMSVKSEYLMRFIATTSGAVIALAVISALAAVVHLVIRDRKYIDSLRFTAVTIIPIAVLNGLFSHGLQTSIDNAEVSAEAMKMSIFYMPWGYLVLNLAFYLSALWVMGKRTGVNKKKRWVLLGIGLSFMAVYLAGGLMISPSEWQILSA